MDIGSWLLLLLVLLCIVLGFILQLLAIQTGKGAWLIAFEGITMFTLGIILIVT